MSGNGGSRGDGPPPREATNCENLVVTTLLNSPAAKIVATLKKGDRLRVIVRKVASISRLEALDSGGKVAGSLTPNELLRIISCIEEGHDYVAVLLNDPAGGSVRVRIQSASKP